MWFFLDLIVVGIVLFYVITSAKKGFARTFIELVGFGLSIYLATLIGGAVGTAFYEKTVEPKIIETVKTTVQETAGNTTLSTVDNIWDDFPDVITSSAEHFGVDLNTVKDSINNQISNKVDIETIAKSISDTTLKPICITVAKTIISIVIFTILMFVVKILAKALNKIFKLPIIGGLNSSLGAVLGLGKGVIMSIVVCMLISLIVALTGNGFWIFTKENIDKTYIFSLLSNLKLL